MPFEHRDMSGSIFKNDRREKETHPHYTGSCKINGQEFWISAWIKEATGKSKGKWMSFAFKPKEGSGGHTAGMDASLDDFDDDIPF